MYKWLKVKSHSNVFLDFLGSITINFKFGLLSQSYSNVEVKFRFCIMMWIVTVWSDPITIPLDFVCTLQAPTKPNNKLIVDPSQSTRLFGVQSSKSTMCMCSSFLERNNQTKYEVDCQSITINQSFWSLFLKIQSLRHVLFLGDWRSISYWIEFMCLFNWIVNWTTSKIWVQIRQKYNAQCCRQVHNVIEQTHAWQCLIYCNWSLIISQSGENLKSMVTVDLKSFW